MPRSNCAAGEVHALMGENGAGKSTLIKTSRRARDAGRRARSRLDGRPARAGPARRRQGGSGSASSTRSCNIVPRLSVAENMLPRVALSRPCGGFVDWRALNAPRRTGAGATRASTTSIRAGRWRSCRPATGCWCKHRRGAVRRRRRARPALRHGRADGGADRRGVRASVRRDRKRWSRAGLRVLYRLAPDATR